MLAFFVNKFQQKLYNANEYMGQVTKLRLSCYLVMQSIDSKTR